MSFAPHPAKRRQTHLRRITCEAFERDDGLIDIEGLLIDTKPTTIDLLTGKKVAPAEPIHQMRVRLTVNRECLIVDALAFSEHNPYPECADAEAAYRKLIGMRIEPGFTQEVKRLFRGTGGCTHLSEMISPLASTVFQVLWADSDFGSSEPGIGGQRSSPLGGCHALRLNGQIVRTYFPLHYKDSTP